MSEHNFKAKAEARWLYNSSVVNLRHSSDYNLYYMISRALDNINKAINLYKKNGIVPPKEFYLQRAMCYVEGRVVNNKPIDTHDAYNGVLNKLQEARFVPTF